MSDSADFEDLDYRSAGGVAWIEVDRPATMHSLRHETLAELVTARQRAEETDGVRAIVVGSRGDDAFCTGADLDLIGSYTDDADAIDRWLTDWRDAITGLRGSDLPVVGCVTGPALAGGLELVLACDVVVAGVDAVFGDQHLNYDLVPGGNGTQLLPRIVGPRRAKYLILTGDTIDAETARAWGLVNEVSSAPREAAEALAGRITDSHPDAVRRAKHLVDDGLESTLADGLDLEHDVASRHLTSKVASEGIERFQRR